MRRALFPLLAFGVFTTIAIPVYGNTTTIGSTPQTSTLPTTDDQTTPNNIQGGGYQGFNSDSRSNACTPKIAHSQQHFDPTYGQAIITGTTGAGKTPCTAIRGQKTPRRGYTPHEGGNSYIYN
ncbi:MAG: Pal1 cell morphology protein [Phormidesmis priestleyi Ana]|uniref:Pal1 cell morphology protein n=1 Tax=Phormidesmis priestleyi Ana TaxID=1666911 RepID=A0A0P7YQ00_9CYAN|nr:MAG: Pal1 cell morphology protein [Phormidesmis priestleyi Ana]